MTLPLLFIPFFQDNPDGILAAFLSMLCFGFADSLWRGPSQAFGAPRTIFFRNFLVLLIVIPYYLISKPPSYISQDAILATVGISLLSYLGLYSFSQATKVGFTSVVVPLSSTHTLVTMALHIVILDHSQFNVYAGAGAAVTLLGLLLLKVNWRNGRFDLIVLKEGGLRYAFLAAIFWGLSFGYSWFVVTFIGPPLFTLIQESVILILAGIHTLVLLWANANSQNPFQRSFGLFEKKEAIDSEFEDEDEEEVQPKKSRWVFSRQFKQQSFIIILISLLGAGGTIFNTIAMDKASINTVTGIVVVAPVIAVFFGQFYYGEHLTWQQKLAVFLLISGVFAISYFRYYN